jgi:GNAT superfamily N-acetyltransferase
VLPRVVRVGDTDITIRQMGADYLMADSEPEGVSVQLTCRQFAEVWPNPIYATYYGKLTEAYGAAAILAWQGNAVVGFLPFTPQGSRLALPHCIHYVPGSDGELTDPDADPVERTPLDVFEGLDPKVLVVQCVSVQPELRREGLGTEMVRYLVDWAREQGWERIEGSAFIRGDWKWLPDVEFWENAGFTRGAQEDSTLEFGPSCAFHIVE